MVFLVALTAVSLIIRSTEVVILEAVAVAYHLVQAVDIQILTVNVRLAEVKDADAHHVEYMRHSSILNVQPFQET